MTKPAPFLKLKLSICPVGSGKYWRQFGGANQSEMKAFGLLMISFVSNPSIVRACPYGHSN